MALNKAVKKENKFPRINFLVVGFIILALALVIPASTFAPVFKAEFNYRLNQNKNSSTEPTPVDPEFSIVIPKINANAKVVPNVDPFNAQIYQRALIKGVAHAKGTSTPNQSGNTFIFAHSAGNWYQANRFNAVFYLLDKLISGDEIIVYYQGQKYTYTVQDKKLIKSDDLSYMSSKIGQNQLTLMTCWPPGTTLKRLVVVASLQND